MNIAVSKFCKGNISLASEEPIRIRSFWKQRFEKFSFEVERQTPLAPKPNFFLACRALTRIHLSECSWCRMVLVRETSAHAWHLSCKCQAYAWHALCIRLAYAWYMPGVCHACARNGELEHMTKKQTGVGKSMFTSILNNGKGQKLCRIILLHIGLVTSNFHLPQIPNVLIFMIFGTDGNVHDPRNHYS